MTPKRKSQYGYKVCYKEKGRSNYVRHFLTYTYAQAKKAKAYFIKYPQNARDDNHLLRKPNWVIIPVKKSEVRAGIWHEVPFWDGKIISFSLSKKQKQYTEELK